MLRSTRGVATLGLALVSACSAAQPDAPVERIGTIQRVAPVAHESHSDEASPPEEARENRARCARGDLAGCHAAGLDAYYSRPGPKTDRDAYDYFKRACDAGYAPSCNGLGVLAAEGRGVPKDEAEAARLYRQACDDGATTACEHLSQALAVGRGVAKDAAAAARAHERSRCVFDASLHKRTLASCPALDAPDVPDGGS